MVVVMLAMASPASAATYRLGIVGKSHQGEYWSSVMRGARREARTQGVQILVKGPPRETDTAAQIRLVEQLIASDVDGIALAPVDSRALGPVVRKAVRAGIKVVTFDTDTVDKDRLSYIGTDNVGAGRKAGEAMLKIVSEGKVAIVTGVPEAQNLRQRVEGFRRAMLGTRMRLLEAQPDQGSRARAIQIAERTLAAHPDLSAFFTDNAIAGPAIGEVVKKSGRKVAVVSFDGTPTMLGFVQNGVVQAVIAQNPEKMGRLSVKTLVRALEGETLPPVIDTGVEVVTRDGVPRDGVPRDGAKGSRVKR